jgi:serine/threonine-protein kinase
LIACPTCGSGVSEAARFCSACGEAVSSSSASQLPTNVASPSMVEKARRPPSSSKIGRLASSDSIPAGGFTPGVVLAERYRIIGLLGRGGMGEVYRADDLKLGQPVALKFLPERFAAEKDRLERFYAEVRIARQVSHPNVCRVYDVGEIEGQHYLSMEYVDGEDLASLLKRIGRLPSDKALEIARELCAGLAAAHDRGVLHRDLKPSNVMVDGRGRARITDFGLAVAAGDAQEAEVSGTPAYMAPEQLAGKGASVRSDIYALGLVLYELSTGKKAFDASSFEDLRRKHAESTPTAPSAVAPGFDPAVERVILRCLEKDPAQRPSSVAQVAAALPGGDPLAAAIAAGETPSPEMVAAAGEQGVIAPSTARILLLALAVALLLAVVVSPRASVLTFAGVDKPPDVLRERAREILQGIGVGKPADSANWFRTDLEFLSWARARGGVGGDLSRDAVAFIYRQSPAPMFPALADTGPFPSPTVTSLNPAPGLPGMAEVWVDPRGRLVRLATVPAELSNDGAASPETDWGSLFRQAGLDPGRFSRVEPRWSPPTYATERAAWEGPHPDRAGVTMRIEAASFRGRPVSFLWIGPWTRPARDPLNEGASQISTVIFEIILFGCFLGGALLARHNVRSGRGDRRGAARFAAAVGGLTMAMWILGGHHARTAVEGWMFLEAFSNAAGTAVIYWVIYLALEPYARRRWPQMLISWARALSGRWRDPLVGRDLLIGATIGAAASLIAPLRVVLPARLGIRGPLPVSLDSSAPVTLGNSIAWLMSDVAQSAFWVLGIVLVLVVVRRLVRVGWLAGLIVSVLFAATYFGSLGSSLADALNLAWALLAVGILVATTVRFGVLAAIMAEACTRAFGFFIFSSEPSNWAFYAGMIPVSLVIALAWWATKTALAGKPLFGGLESEG